MPVYEQCSESKHLFLKVENEYIYYDNTILKKGMSVLLNWFNNWHGI